MQVAVPEKLAPLLQPARYKGAHGGRGSGKSHFFAQMAVLTNYSRPTRGVAIREVQNSIKDSVKQLIEDKIQALGLGDFFDVLRDEIRGRNGSHMIFRGMQSYNAENIKSLEDFDWAWVEEAQSLSAVSLRLLRPTIRKDNSELWFAWNPRHDNDAVDELLRGPHKPANAIVVECNHSDNPWFPAVLREEMQRDYATDPELAEHVWGGGYEIISEGAYYARLLAHAEREGRIGFFPHEPKRKVKTSWDIGVDDHTAVWFWQDDGRTATVIDYYEATGEGAEDVMATALPELFRPPEREERFAEWTQVQALADLGRLTPYNYDRHYLPHDVKLREWGSGARSRIETLQRLGMVGIHRGAAANPSDRIQAVRQLLPVTRFNDTPRVQMGLKRLKRYRRKWNDALQSYTVPLHDENSHGADAFGEFAINSGLFPPIEKPAPKPVETRMPTLDELVAEHDKRHARMSRRGVA